ncbi:MAG: hypothetical protein H0V67_05270 [Geodermatophilaceae bacterium]|nr:hypothetical protein [Geodermatophilaceae bacterium]
MKTWLKCIAITATVAAIAVVAPSTAQAAPYCGITWGSLDKGAGRLSDDPLTNVRAGRHTCYDRLVVDFDGSPAGYTVRYVSAVPAQGTGNPIPLRGGAFLEIALQAPAYDPNTGTPTYTPANPKELVNVSGWRTFRQAASGGSFEGYTTIGLGVRGRLPFRVFTLAGPRDGSRLVIDVAHQW